MDQSAGMGKRKKDKAWVLDCQQLLIEISVQLEKVSKQNQKLKQQIKQGQRRQIQFKLQINNLQKERKQYLHQSKEEVREKQQLKQQIRLADESHKRQIQQIIGENNQFKTNIERITKERDTLAADKKQLKIQLQKANQKINQSFKQTEQLKKKLVQLQSSHKKDIAQFTDFTYNIKKGFDVIEKDYAMNEEDQHYKSPIIDHRRQESKQKRQSSTSHKYNRRSNTAQRHPTIKPFEANPEMERELDHIKKQIKDQYRRIDNSRDTLMKTRVDRTLANIQTILTQISTKVQHSQSDSSNY